MMGPGIPHIQKNLSFSEIKNVEDKQKIPPHILLALSLLPMAQQAPTYTYTNSYQTYLNVEVISKYIMLYCAFISSCNKTLFFAI
jgi:hypothetical protein